MKWNSLLFLILIVSLSHNSAGQDATKRLLSSLKIKVVDADKTTKLTDQRIVRRFEIHSSLLKKPMEVAGQATRMVNGFVPFPKGIPTFGRVRLWVRTEVDKSGFRHGYGEYSYDLQSKSKDGEAAILFLEQGRVIHGQVVDSKHGSPIPGAEVAPEIRRYEVDWTKKVVCDMQGNFRIGTTSSEAVVARAGGYQMRMLLDYKSERPIIRLPRLLKIPCQVVDEKGAPIEDVQCSSADQKSNEKGRTNVHLLADASRDLLFHADGFESTSISPRDLFAKHAKTSPVKIRLIRSPRYRGRVTFENGTPVRGAKVDFGSGFFSLPDPVPTTSEDGSWETAIGLSYENCKLRVLIDQDDIFENTISLENWDPKKPILTRVPLGHTISGQVTGLRSSKPFIRLFKTEDDRFYRIAKVSDDGKFDFRFLPKGEYLIEVRPIDFEGLKPNWRYWVERCRELKGPKWQKRIRLSRNDVELGELDVANLGLLNSSISGSVYDPDDDYRPFANAFGYLSTGYDDFFQDTGGIKYIRQFMTDSRGRFRIDGIVPGKYLVRFTTSYYGPRDNSPSCWVRLSSGKHHQVALFDPGKRKQIALTIRVGNGSQDDAFSGLAIDRETYWKYHDAEKKVFPFVENDFERILADPPKVVVRFLSRDFDQVISPIFNRHLELDPVKLAAGKGLVYKLDNVEFENREMELIATNPIIDEFEERIDEFKLGAKMRAKGKHLIRLEPSSIFAVLPAPATVTAERLDKPAGVRVCKSENVVRMIGVAPGRYRITVNAEGYKEVSKTIEVEPRKIAKLTGIVLQKIEE